MYEERSSGVSKCVFPVAGLGTRFLPATKASPKEMLPVVDKPLIQYAAEEAVEAGISDLIFVTGRSKRSIEDHFDKAYELEAELESAGKARMLQLVRGMLPERVRCVYVRQSEALGLGHAVTRANHLIGNEPFAISLADDLIDADPPVLKQMVDAYQYYRCSIIGVQRIPPEETDQYGIVRINGDFHDGVGRVLGIVEKPKPEDAPSNWAVVGRYVFTPGLFRCFDSVVPGAGGEIQLTDAIAALLRREQVLAYEFTGKRYDCGSKLGYLQANVEFGLKHPELSEPFREYLRSLIA